MVVAAGERPKKEVIVVLVVGVGCLFCIVLRSGNVGTTTTASSGGRVAVVSGLGRRHLLLLLLGGIGHLGLMTYSG